MKTNVLDIKTVISAENLMNLGYRYAWVQTLDQVLLVPVDINLNFDVKKLLEARIFSDDKELHIFEYEDELRCVETVTEAVDDYYEEKQLLRPKYGVHITMRHFLAHEEDGQAYISRSVLCGYEGGNN